MCFSDVHDISLVVRTVILQAILPILYLSPILYKVGRCLLSLKYSQFCIVKSCFIQYFPLKLYKWCWVFPCSSTMDDKLWQRMVAAGSKPVPRSARVEHLFQIQDQIGTNILKPCRGWIHLFSRDVGSSQHVWLQYQNHWDRPNPPKHSTAFGEMKFESKFCLGPVVFLRGSWESPKGSTGITWVIRNVFAGGIRL